MKKFQFCIIFAPKTHFKFARTFDQLNSLRDLEDYILKEKIEGNCIKFYLEFEDIPILNEENFEEFKKKIANFDQEIILYLEFMENERDILHLISNIGMDETIKFLKNKGFDRHDIVLSLISLNILDIQSILQYAMIFPDKLELMLKKNPEIIDLLINNIDLRKNKLVKNFKDCKEIQLLVEFEQIKDENQLFLSKLRLMNKLLDLDLKSIIVNKVMDLGFKGNKNFLRWKDQLKYYGEKNGEEWKDNQEAKKYNEEVWEVLNQLSFSKEELIDLHKENGIIVSLNNHDLPLWNWRVADGFVYGQIGICPECKTQNLVYNGHAYICEESSTKCTFKGNHDSIKRYKWNVPDTLKEHTFFKSFKTPKEHPTEVCIVLKEERIDDLFDHSFGKDHTIKKESNALGIRKQKNKFEDEMIVEDDIPQGLELHGMTFDILGSFETLGRTQEEIKEIIKKHGGKLSTIERDSNATVFISSKDDVREFAEKLEQARIEKIPILGMDWLVKLTERDGEGFELRNFENYQPYLLNPVDEHPSLKRVYSTPYQNKPSNKRRKEKDDESPEKRKKKILNSVINFDINFNNQSNSNLGHSQQQTSYQNAENSTIIEAKNNSNNEICFSPPKNTEGTILFVLNEFETEVSYPFSFPSFKKLKSLEFSDFIKFIQEDVLKNKKGKFEIYFEDEKIYELNEISWDFYLCLDCRKNGERNYLKLKFVL